MSDRPLALVTGGSSGIGLELAKQLAERGHDVALSGSSDRTEEAAATLRGLGVEAYPHRADAAPTTASRASGSSPRRSAGRSRSPC